MQFRSYTYDSTEIDIQYALDSRGNEIREIQLDEAFSGEKLVAKTWVDGWTDLTPYLTLTNRLGLVRVNGDCKVLY